MNIGRKAVIGVKNLPQHISACPAAAEGNESRALNKIGVHFKIPWTSLSPPARGYDVNVESQSSLEKFPLDSEKWSHHSLKVFYMPLTHLVMILKVRYIGTDFLTIY